MEKEIKEGEIIQAIDSQMPDLGPIYYCKLIEKITENEWTAEASMSMPFSPLGRVKIAYCEEDSEWAVISFS